MAGHPGLIRGLYSPGPSIAGSWPRDDYALTTENNGMLIDIADNRGAMT